MFTAEQAVVDDALHRVARAVREATRDLGPDDLAIVACSGGPDSLALAAGAAWLAVREGGPRFGAAIVDHQLQKGSGHVAERAAAACRELGLRPVVVCRVSVPTGPGVGGIEAAARGVRRSALIAAAAEAGARAILLGHTLDDQAETVLLRLARGSGARSLGAMAPVDGVWRRPLLGLRRELTTRATIGAGLSPHADPHNVDARFSRSRVRGVILPLLESELGPRVAEALARSADLLRADADALEAWAGRWLDEYDAESMKAAWDGSTGSSPLVLDAGAVTELGDLPTAVRTRVLRERTIAAGVSPSALTYEHIRAVDRLVTAWRGQGAATLPGDLRVRRDGGCLIWESGSGR